MTPNRLLDAATNGRTVKSRRLQLASTMSSWRWNWASFSRLADPVRCNHLNCSSLCQMIRALFRVALLLCLAWSSHAQQREQRVALVIGNGAYQSSPLKNPVNDATDMAQALKDKGFAVTLRTNIGNRDMRQAIRAFSQTLKAGGVGLFYFAGHGVQSKGRNYLIPLNAEIKEEFELEDEAFDANRVLAGMEEAGNRVNIVILDACRDNPFGRAWRTSATGLAQLSAPIGSFVAFATAPGSVAADGSGRNGLFTSHLLTSLRNPDSDIDRVFTRVAAAVARESGNKQVPWKSSSLTGEFCFADCGRANQPPVVVAQASNTSDDRFFWESVKDTKDANELKAYLNKFPGGLFAELAGIRLRSLEQAAADRIAAEAAQRAALERAAAEAAAKEQQRLAMEAQAKEQARVAAEAAQKLAAARLAELYKPGQIIKDCADCPEMVVITAGSFEMGSDERTDERPLHRVNVPSFLIGNTEVTQSQWRAVMGSNPSRFSQCYDDCPVERVRWSEAQDFARRLSQKTGKQYRLPSEAEWEYAARAGSNSKWSFGEVEDQLGDYAWYGSNSQNKTQGVAQKKPNACGLFDMHGNVWEWVQDCWHDNYAGAPVDGRVWTTGCSDNMRVLRGGSWYDSPSGLRSAYRIRVTPIDRGVSSGLRLARTP